MCIFPKPPKSQGAPPINTDTTQARADEAKRRGKGAGFSSTISPETLLGGMKPAAPNIGPKTLLGGG